jgi:hypothetical protein
VSQIDKAKQFCNKATYFIPQTIFINIERVMNPKRIMNYTHVGNMANDFGGGCYICMCHVSQTVYRPTPIIACTLLISPQQR